MDEQTANLPTRKRRLVTVKHGLWSDFRKSQLDGRTRLARWVAVLRGELLRDLGNDLSAMERVLLDRIIFKIIRCSLYERGILQDQNFGSRDFYLSCCNSLRLDLSALGLKKRLKTVTDLASYLKKKEENHGTKAGDRREVEREDGA